MKKVIFLSDCKFKDWDTDFECPICPVCEIYYVDCGCPGPSQDDEFDYVEIDDELFAIPKNQSQ